MTTLINWAPVKRDSARIVPRCKRAAPIGDNRRVPRSPTHERTTARAQAAIGCRCAPARILRPNGPSVACSALRVSRPKSSVRTPRIKDASIVRKNSGRRTDQALSLKGIAAKGAGPDRSQTTERHLGTVYLRYGDSVKEARTSLRSTGGDRAVRGCGDYITPEQMIRSSSSRTEPRDPQQIVGVPIAEILWGHSADRIRVNLPRTRRQVTFRS
jgi:hypothetical protein